MDLFSQIADITRPAFIPVPAQPEERKPRIFTNIADAITEIRKIGHADQLNYQQFKALYLDISSQSAAITAMINKMTIAEINKYVYKHSSSDSKKEMVSRLFDSLIGSFNLGGLISYSPFGGGGPTTYAEALQQQLNKQTEQDYINYCTEKQAARDQRKKALESPETLEEFRIFLQYRKPEAMTTEQRISYDLLLTEGSQDRRERESKYKAEVKAVNIEGLQMEIKTSHHAKKNIPLWVVALGDRVESDQFNELKEKARKLGGYYSSYRGQGAIPGFTFETEEGANLFTGLQDGNVNARDIQLQTEEQKAQERAANLTDKAERIEEAATDQLNRQRKDNTAKRAREAASAERTALYNLEFADIMKKIAEGQTAGTIKFLNRLTNITDLNTLFSILSDAKYRYIKETGMSYREQESADFDKIPEVINYVVFPFPVVWKENVTSDLLKLENYAGCKMAAQRMLKRLKGAKEDVRLYVTGTTAIEDYETLLCTPHRGIYNGTIDHYKEMLLKYKRCIRMHLETLPELRTALRELMNIKNNVVISPELLKAQQIREIERKFVGKNIDGFFPTPGGTDPMGLARQTVNSANIQPGNTICEPSAGLGHIADVIAELYPDNEITVIEQYQPLYEALCLKGYNNGATCEDFLQHTGTYDRIIMNPPFENGQDIDHVTHAYNLLNPGGRLVAIMAGNKQKQDRKTVEFMGLVDKCGSWEQNAPGSFLSAFRPTGVNTITVILDK